MASLAVLHGSIEANADGLIRSMDKAATGAERAARRSENAWRSSARAQTEAVLASTKATEEAMRRIDNLAGTVGSSIRMSIGGAFAALGVGSAAQILHMTDSWNNLEQRVRSATKATGDYAPSLEKLYGLSQKAGVAMGDTVDVFQRLNMSAKALGATNQDIINVVETVQKLGAIGGSTTTAMQYGLVQMSQALGGNVMRMEEFNSLNENIPLVLDRIAEGLGMTRAELGNLVRDGRVLSKDIFASILSQTQRTNAEFSDLSMTVDRSMKVAENSLGRLFSTIDKSLGGTKALADMMKTAATNADDIRTKFELVAKSIDFARDALDRYSKVDITKTTYKDVGVPGTPGYRPGVKTMSTETDQASISEVAAAGQAIVQRQLADKLRNPNANIIESGFGMANALNENAIFAEIQKQREKDAMARAIAEPLPGAGTPAGTIKPDLQSPKNKGNQNPTTLDDLLKNLQTQAQTQQLIAEGRKTEAEVVEEIARIEDRLNISLTERGKMTVRRIVTERENAKVQVEANKESQILTDKAFKDLIKQQETYQKINVELRDRLAGLGDDAAGQTFALQIGKERLRLEEQMKTLTEEQRDNLRSIFEEYSAGKRASVYQDTVNKITGGLTEDDQNGLAGIMDPRKRAEAQEWIKIQNEMERQGAPGSSIDAAAGVFDAQSARNKTIAANDYLFSLGKQTEEMRHQVMQQDELAAGNEYIAELDKKILEAEEAKGAALSEQEKQVIAINVAYQQQYRDIEKARGIINSQKDAQEKFNDAVRDLTPLLQQGLLTQNQFNKALWQAHPQYEKIKALSQDIGQAFSSGVERAIFSGEKFTDVLKNMEKELALIVARKLLFEPLANGISKGIQNMWAQAAGLPQGPSGSGGTAMGLGGLAGVGSLAGGGLPPGLMGPLAKIPGIGPLLAGAAGGGANPLTGAAGAGGITSPVPVWIVGGVGMGAGAGGGMGGPGGAYPGMTPFQVPMTGGGFGQQPGGGNPYGKGSSGSAMAGAAFSGAQMAGGNPYGKGGAAGGGAAGGPPPGATPYELGQWRDEQMRQEAERIMNDPNASPLDKSMAAYSARGYGTPVFNSSSQHLAWTGWSGSSGGNSMGGDMQQYSEHGSAIGGSNIGPAAGSNRAMENAAQSSRWAYGAPTGAGGAWGTADGGSASRFPMQQSGPVGPWFSEGIDPGMYGPSSRQTTGGIAHMGPSVGGGSLMPEWSGTEQYGPARPEGYRLPSGNYLSPDQYNSAMQSPQGRSLLRGVGISAPEPAAPAMNASPMIGMGQGTMPSNPAPGSGGYPPGITGPYVGDVSGGQWGASPTDMAAARQQLNDLAVSNPEFYQRWVAYQAAHGQLGAYGQQYLAAMNAGGTYHTSPQIGYGGVASSGGNPLFNSPYFGGAQGMRGFARGGRPSIGEMVRVNEHGDNAREFFKPDVGGRVIPLGEMQNAVGDGGGYGAVEVHNYGSDPIRTVKQTVGGRRKLDVYIARGVAQDINRGGPVGQAVSSITPGRRKPATKH